MPSAMNPNDLPPQVQAVSQMLAQGIIQMFAQYFPTGVGNVTAPVVVQRKTKAGLIMQQTNFCNLIAEQIDESKALRKAINELADLTDEALENSTKVRKRRLGE